ncbi:MAG: hypothetical protein U0163_09860 [Gemmatimonadaceae bacterium]
MLSLPIHFSASTAPVRVIVVRTRERIADAAAALFLVGGVSLFLLGRRALTALANGTYQVPVGESYVDRADLHNLQTKVGLWMAAFGLAISLAAALSHSRTSRRRSAQRPLAKADA